MAVLSILAAPVCGPAPMVVLAAVGSQLQPLQLILVGRCGVRLRGGGALQTLQVRRGVPAVQWWQRWPSIFHGEADFLHREAALHGDLGLLPGWLGCCHSGGVRWCWPTGQGPSASQVCQPSALRNDLT